MSNKCSDIHNLVGKILLSTPSISNEYLNKSMVYICSHDKNGAMGIVVNKLIPNMNIKDILKRLNIKSDGFENLDTYFGGAEEINRCFILHSDDYLSSESTIISNNIALTINADIMYVQNIVLSFQQEGEGEEKEREEGKEGEGKRRETGKEDYYLK
ncbi:MAG: YqgE/AlgH family protein [Holosporaceae bacterium]|nr:YqgE/AlgH family protein [Holosporaceae bacterium]